MHFENSHKKAQMIFWSLLCLFVAGLTHSKAQTVDAAGWGGNHVGKPIPEYVHGDECLFCHRNTIGVTWQKNAHGLTVRQGEDAPELQTLARKLPELSSVQIVNVDTDNKGNLWIQTKSAGIFRLQDEQLKHLTTREGLPSNDLTAYFLEDRNGNLWVADHKNHSLYRIKNGETQLIRTFAPFWLAGPPA